MPAVDLAIVVACVGGAAGYLVWKLVLRSRPKATPVRVGGTLAAALTKHRARKR